MWVLKFLIMLFIYSRIVFLFYTSVSFQTYHINDKDIIRHKTCIYIKNKQQIIFKMFYHTHTHHKINENFRNFHMFSFTVSDFQKIKQTLSCFFFGLNDKLYLYYMSLRKTKSKEMFYLSHLKLSLSDEFWMMLLFFWWCSLLYKWMWLRKYIHFHSHLIHYAIVIIQREFLIKYWFMFHASEWVCLQIQLKYEFQLLFEAHSLFIDCFSRCILTTSSLL